MGIKEYKPITPSLRWKKTADYSEITTSEPVRALTIAKKRISGRNNTGRVTVRFRGGGNKRRYRIIDFKRDKLGIEGRITTIEYDPNRSCRIALVTYADGERRYILAPNGISVGDKIISGEDVPIKIGNALPIKNIPLGTEIHNIEIKPGEGGKLVRSAGLSAQILAKEGDYAHIRLPSGEVRLINVNCYATIGTVGNIEKSSIVLGKAGTKRHLGRRSRSRAIAMNPVDHKMGGGEGRSKSNKHPCSPTGVLAKGYKTRKKKKYSNKFIVKRRR
jgi:large subunit ribosomal protein L2|uniref:Large ribosomal subunit protein uL2 n=1 Tax=candidate division WOR-3 bacterium TaxID=2052148 RepID=A0A7C4YI45_UNCW3